MKQYFLKQVKKHEEREFYYRTHYSSKSLHSSYISLHLFVYRYWQRCSAQFLYFHLYLFVAWIFFTFVLYRGEVISPPVKKSGFTFWCYWENINLIRILWFQGVLLFIMVSPSFNCLKHKVMVPIVFLSYVLSFTMCYFYYNSWHININLFMLIATNIMLCSTIFFNIKSNSQMAQLYFHSWMFSLVALLIIATTIVSIVFIFFKI